eukprot:SAG31_NODE_2733_length_5173_cov_2.072724_1_plen_985_part_00
MPTGTAHARPCDTAVRSRTPSSECTIQRSAVLVPTRAGPSSDPRVRVVLGLKYTAHRLWRSIAIRAGLIQRVDRFTLNLWLISAWMRRLQQQRQTAADERARRDVARTAALENWLHEEALLGDRQLCSALGVCYSKDVETVKDLRKLQLVGKLVDQGFSDIVLAKIEQALGRCALADARAAAAAGTDADHHQLFSTTAWQEQDCSGQMQTPKTRTIVANLRAISPPISLPGSPEKTKIIDHPLPPGLPIALSPSELAADIAAKVAADGCVPTTHEFACRKNYMAADIRADAAAAVEPEPEPELIPPELDAETVESTVSDVPTLPQTQPQSACSRNTLNKCINKSHQWDFFVSHTQRDAGATTIAAEIFFGMENYGRTCWLDVKMTKCDEAAMAEGVRNSKCLIAIVTDNGVDSYFSRGMCRQEVKWALDAGIQIVPVVAAADKPKVGKFIDEAKSHGLDFRTFNFVHFDRAGPLYLQASLETILVQVSGAPKATIVLTFDGSFDGCGSAEQSLEQTVAAIQAEIVEYLSIQASDIEVVSLVKADESNGPLTITTETPKLMVSIEVADAGALDKWQTEHDEKLLCTWLLLAGITAESIKVTITEGSVVMTIRGLPPWAAAAVASGVEAAEEGQLVCQLRAALAGCCTLATTPPTVAVDFLQLSEIYELPAGSSNGAEREKRQSAEAAISSALPSRSGETLTRLQRLRQMAADERMRRDVARTAATAHTKNEISIDQDLSSTQQAIDEIRCSPKKLSTSNAEAAKEVAQIHREVSVINAERTAVKTRLREYEIAFEAKHGVKPRQRLDWAPVIDEYERCSQLHEEEKAAIMASKFSGSGAPPQQTVPIALPIILPKHGGRDERKKHLLRVLESPILYSTVQRGGALLRVANVDGSSDSATKAPHSCVQSVPGLRSNTWKSYWETMSGRDWPKECSCMRRDKNGQLITAGCRNPATSGLHVWIEGQQHARRCYIVPVCLIDAPSSPT